MTESRQVRRAKARKEGIAFIPMEQPPRFVSWVNPLDPKDVRTVQSNACRDESPAQIARCRRESFHLRNA